MIALDRSILHIAVQAARRVAPSKSPRVNLLEALVYEVFGDVRLAATDLAQGLDTPLVGDAASGVRLMLPLSEADAALRTLDDGKVTLSSADGRTTLSAGSASWTWPVSDVVDAESHRGPDDDAEDVAEVDRAALAAAVERVAWACDGAAEGSSRHLLTHVEVAVEDGCVRLRTTNGKVAAEERVEAIGTRPGAELLLTPAALAAALSVGGARATLRTRGGRAEVRSFGCRTWALACALPFPKGLEAAFGVAGDPTAVAPAKAVARAVARAALATDRTSTALDFTVDAAGIAVKHAGAERQAQGGTVPRTAGTGEGACLVAAPYLAKALAACEGDVSLWVPKGNRGALGMRSSTVPRWAATVMTMATDY